ncbi:DarT ssDNA thymidine ADP-ribosyltransferase family protein [Anabaenopsis elenkinii]|uniref:DUF4433 domain-containing protein n=1 Tax=Anabaenopsis elenkinii CCIBt3563 TaxID=2779889 RepID=A0A7U3NLC4_9CYAN|nr:DarT ssDNA thymidine ADP-ribosyltransferase family protein [Anabaenopsis elenkinii]QOV21433.1 DUF4433 domain-containing protein [Anabaenopsis elenkinii CCIBt3563]
MNKIDPRLSKIVEKIESQGYKVMSGRYVRYNVQQKLIKVTISELREVDIFEEFILDTAINIIPSVTTEDLANALGIDYSLLKSVTANLQSLKSLELTSDSTLKITDFGKKIFQEYNSVLEPSYGQNIYAIADPLTQEISINNTRLRNVPLDVKNLCQFIKFDEYPQLSNLTIEDIHNLAINSEAVFLDRERNQEISDYQELSSISIIRKKVAIFRVVDSEEKYSIKIFSEEEDDPEELERASSYLSDIFNSEYGEQVAWEELFQISDTGIIQPNFTPSIEYNIYLPDGNLANISFGADAFLLDERTELTGSVENQILPASSRQNAIEAENIQSFVSQRRIERIVHLTRLENLINICSSGGILSLQQLITRNINTNAFDGTKPEGQRYKNHVNCSLTYYNFFMLYGLVHKSVEPVVLLYIKPDYLWKQGTEFCKFNAATGRGRHIAAGYQTLKSLFEDTVRDRKGLQDRDNKPINLPTCIQAEVLIKDGIPLEDIMEIVIRFPRDEQNVKQAGWRGKIRVSPRDFDWHSEWIVRDS